MFVSGFEPSNVFFIMHYLFVAAVGLHIETKDPLFINSHPVLTDAETTLEDLLLESLVEHGYDIANPREPVFLQSFNENSLRYMANYGTALPLVMLLTAADNVTDARLRQLAEFAYGIGPARRMIVRTNLRNQVSLKTFVLFLPPFLLSWIVEAA